ncbi:MAG TPA: hypothetical protein VKB14_03520 [Actinomycetales bacterium]|nr:hypothetical protein [Actinomycetales bacterium]
MDDHLALIDARVAEAAEAWLNDPRDTDVYARLVLAVRARRQYLEAPAGAVEVQRGAEWARLRQVGELDRGGDPRHADTALTAQPTVPSDQRTNDGDLRPNHGEADETSGPSPSAIPEEVALDRAWPAVRAVGSDLTGDPAAVLRRLRGG